jgi:predicted esterase
VPVFQYHAVADEIVATPQAEALMRAYCAKGVRVTWKTYIAEHAIGIFAGLDDAFAFIQDRVAGRPATSTC